MGAALLAPLIAPHDPYDLKSLELINADLPPAWQERGDRRFLLGTDDQGRDILSTILYGTRASLLIGIASVLLAVVLGVTLGLWAGYAGGRVDSLDHAHCRRPAHLSGHSHRAADRRRGAGDLQELSAWKAASSGSW